MSFWIGDAYSGCTLTGTFTTVSSTGAPSALSGSPLGLVVWKLVGSWTCSTAGLTLSLDCKGATGWNGYSINTNADQSFYACGADYALQLTGGTVNSVCVQYYTIANFSLKNRAGLNPTIHSRALDVTTGGAAGLDWANIESSNTSNFLSCTSVFSSQSVCNSVNIVFTEQGIACTVWNSLQSNYDTCGTFGVLLDCKTSAALQPTTPGVRLDVSSGGEAGIDWANIGTPQSVQRLGCTSFFQVQQVCNSVVTSSNLDKTEYRLSSAALADFMDCSLTEPASVFSQPGTMRTIVPWLGAVSSNCVRQTSTVQTLRNRADSTSIATSNITCETTTMHRGSFA